MATLTGVRVVLADDQPENRTDLRAALDATPSITVVAEAATGHSAMRQSLLHRPDVLVVEPGMPDGTSVIKHVRRSSPDVAVLALASDDTSLRAAIGAGALGYIRKDATPEAVIRAIHCVAAGDAILDRTVTARLAELMSAEPARQELPLPGLTAREHEVLDLIAAGLPNSVITARLHVAARTVRNHITAIFTKLGVTRRTEAIELAKAAGLGKPTDLPAMNFLVSA